MNALLIIESLDFQLMIQSKMVLVLVVKEFTVMVIRAIHAQKCFLH